VTNREWERKNVAKGLCEHCSAPRVTARHCRKHAAMHVAHAMKRRAKLRASGRCITCGGELATAQHCEKHRKMAAASEQRLRLAREKVKLAKGICSKPGCDRTLKTKTMCEYHRAYYRAAYIRHKEKLLTAQH
jgi:hypothetical protein